MEESKELQGFYRIAAVYVSVLLEFFEYAFDPSVFGDWGGILADLHGRIKRWAIYSDGHLVYSKLATVLLICITCIGTRNKKHLESADLYHLYRHTEQETSGVQRQASGHPAAHVRPCTARPLRMAVRPSDGDAAVHAARTHHPLYGSLPCRRDTGSCGT